MANLRWRGIGSSKPCIDIREIAAAHCGYQDDCPVSERIARTVLVIPSHPRLTDEEVSLVLDSVNEAWAKVADLAVG